MSGVPLSSNWMKLQGKNKGKSSSDARMKVSKVTKTETRTKDDAPIRTILIPSVYVVRKSPALPEETKSLTEAALWNKESHIQPSDLVKQSTYTLKPEDGKISGRKTEPGKFLAIDCEFVGVGPEGKDSALARVSIVNFYGHLVLDKYVKPKEKVTDWRTWVSGIQPHHMQKAISFEAAQQLCSDLFADRVLVGHAIHHDLGALFLSHPAYLIRDTSKHLPFRKISNGKTPGLKKLAKEYLDLDIQGGEHSSVEDARATMLLYRLHKREFEIIHRQKYSKGKNHLGGGQRKRGQ